MIEFELLSSLGLIFTFLVGCWLVYQAILNLKDDPIISLDPYRDTQFDKDGYAEKKWDWKA